VCVGCASVLCHGQYYRLCMKRPEVDDENIERLDRIINKSVAVPLPADELSINQKLRIVTTALITEIEEIEKGGVDTAELVVDRAHLDNVEN